MPYCLNMITFQTTFVLKELFLKEFLKPRVFHLLSGLRKHFLMPDFFSSLSPKFLPRLTTKKSSQGRNFLKPEIQENFLKSEIFIKGLLRNGLGLLKNSLSPNISLSPTALRAEVYCICTGEKHHTQVIHTGENPHTQAIHTGEKPHKQAIHTEGNTYIYVDILINYYEKSHKCTENIFIKARS